MVLPSAQSLPLAAPCVCQKASRIADGQVKPCARRLAFAKAARELIVEKGLEGLRTRDIAERAGTNIATLHYHLPTKEDLILVVAESVRAEFIAQDEEHPREGMTPRQMLRQEFDDFAELITYRRDLLLVMSEFFERARRDSVVLEIFGGMRARWLQAVAEILAAGIKDGSFRQDLDPIEGALVITSALTGAAKEADLTDRNLTNYFNQLERLFLADQSVKSGH